MTVAVIFAAGELPRLYTGLSLLASGGEASAGLATFAALEPLLDAQLRGRALREPGLADGARFAATLDDLRDLLAPRIWACSASVECTGVSRADVEDRLAGVSSTPRFLAGLAADTRLVVV